LLFCSIFSFTFANLFFENWNRKAIKPMTKHQIALKNSGEPITLNPHFSHSTNGQAVNFETKVSIKSDDNFLYLTFECLQDNFVAQNNMYQHNDPLYNQEVFELFISPGFEDSKHYLEIEINPNNAIWVGTINNPTLGTTTQTLEAMISYESSGIIHEATKSENSWNGKLQIPWALIGKDSKGQYRINFYRIRANQSHESPNWECDAQSCDFVCWSSTLSGESPAFHRPKRFGFLTVE
jgi:Carbohydrate-binding family 9